MVFSSLTKAAEESTIWKGIVVKSFLNGAL